MGSIKCPQICFTLLLILPNVAPFAEAFGGTCYRINYKEATCGKLIRNSVTMSSCCNGSNRRAWSPSVLKGKQRKIVTGGNVTLVEGHANDIQQNLGCFPCYTNCNEINCSEDQKCVMKNQLPKCVCNPMCHLQHKSAVCGTDGRTYSSECQLLKRSCRKKQRLVIKHNGPCQTCSGVRCKPKKTCVLDELLTPQCIKCPKNCPNNLKKPICGNDDVTYASRCHMKKQACERGETIEKAYRGPCRANATCGQISCRRGETCLTEPGTLRPLCSYCEDLHNCKASQKDICGSDGTFYQSWCAFKHASCRSKKAFTIVPLHLCNRNSSKISAVASSKKSSSHLIANECKDINLKKKKARRRLVNQFLTEEERTSVPGHLPRVIKNERPNYRNKKRIKDRKRRRRKKDC